MDDAGGAVLHKIDVDEYYRMADAGLLHKNDRVELIEGKLVWMAPIGLDHGATVDSLAERLFLAFAGRAIVSVQNPFRLDRHSEPEPDFSVSRWREDRYRTRRAGPEDALVLIEVADSSLAYDRDTKLPLYARFGVPEVWLLDLHRRVLESHRRPEDGRYTEMSIHRSGETLALALAPDLRVTLDRVFD